MNDPEVIFQAGAAAFGDGSHPTTRMVLAALDSIDPEAFAPSIACDMGAGSGVLSLAVAAKFGCKVVAVDIERQAVETLRANALHNRLDGRIVAVHADGFRHAQVESLAPFDLIVMNILAEPLLALATDAVAALETGGVLILSGLLRWQEESLRAAYEGLGLELTSRLALGDWVALVLQKP
ncbi:MAG: 50S ribosomal protein L11 methyltransferase [Alphaproteobacteria bacterium]